VNPRRGGLLPALCCAGALAAAAQSPPLGLALALPALVLAGIGPRLELDGGRQFLTSAIGAGAGYLTAALSYEAESGTISDGWARFSAAALVAGCARFLLVAPRGELRPMLVLLFVALLAAGKSTSVAYTPLVVLFLVSSLWAFGGGGERRAPPSSRRVAFATLLVVIAASLGLGATLGLRRMQAWLKNRVHSSAYAWSPQVGFSERMDLGALDGLLDSDRIVLRVRGDGVDYLRGTSLDLYETGRWLRSDEAAPERQQRFSGGAARPARVTIEALSERTNRFFLPLEARNIVTLPDEVVVDGMGSVRRAAKGEAPRASFELGERDRAAPAGPRDADIRMPRSVWRSIKPLMLEWTRGADSPEQRLEAIERHLRGNYRYSRSFARDRRLDPIVDFLLVDGSGHCEYFAAALALGARTVGIPTRVVMGYRVAEKSPFGYHVVREKNAHAWVEAWLPGRGWVTRDATPAEALPQNLARDAGYLASSLDAIEVGYDELTTWLEQRSVQETSSAWLIGLAILALIVVRGMRRRKERRAAVSVDEAPLACLAHLLASLERQGHLRHAGEPIERLAARVPDAEAADLLARYSALRYGGRGSAQRLEHDVAEYARSRAAQ
jgi:transglutaminase-like putative cysteine protease